MLHTLRLMAHAGEVHATAAENQTHYLQEWYVALPLAIVAVAIIGAATYAVTKSRAVTLLVVAAVLLIGGIALYNVSTVVSVAALSSGLAVTLLSVLASLGKKES